MLFEGTAVLLGGAGLSGSNVLLSAESPLLSDKGCLSHLLQWVPVQFWPSWAGLWLSRALLAKMAPPQIISQKLHLLQLLEKVCPSHPLSRSAEHQEQAK